MSKKVSFFFGAGAEGNRNFDICSGYKFMKSTLLTFDEHKRYTAALNKAFTELDKDSLHKYRANTIDVKDKLIRNLILSKLDKEGSSNKFYDNYKSEISACLTKEDFSCFPEKREKISGAKLSDEVNEEIKTILSDNNKCYKVKSVFLKELFCNKETGEIDIDYRVGLGNVVDRYFYSIINPERYGKVKFAKVVNYYWLCYFSVVEDILKYIISHSNIEEVISKAEEYHNDCELSFLENMHDFSKWLYSVDIPYNEGSYYSLINKAINESGNEINLSGIITTNYFRFCEQYFDKATVSHPNGKLCMFEFPGELIVRDASVEQMPNNILFFPFIFGQSYIKPIIHPVQIEEFVKMKNILDNSDVLVILGYGINNDDNHINAYLKQFIFNEEKRMIIVSGNDRHNALETELRKMKFPMNRIKMVYKDFRNSDNAEIVKEVFDKL